MAQAARQLCSKCAVLSLAAAAAGCGAGDEAPREPSAAGDASIVFHRGNGAEPGTLDPHRTEDTAASEVVRDLFEGLVTEAVDATLAPGVAESWETSADGLTYTFHLRDNARWSNGDAVVAEDFVAGLRRTVDPATASSYAQILYPIAGAEAVVTGAAKPETLGVAALDERTLEIRLTAPTPYLLSLLTHPSTFPLHRASFAVHGDGFARPGNLISNGAYRLAEWVVQSHIKLVKNEHYSGASGVQIEEVYFYPIENQESELSRYRAGQLDFIEKVPNSRLEWIGENLADELHVAPYLGIAFYAFDLTEPPFDDVRLRQALTMAVERDVLVEQVTGAGEIPAYSLVPPGVAGALPYAYAWQALSREERLAEARRLYEAAGYGPGNPLRVSIRYNTSDNHRRVAIAVASMWREALGVETSLLNEEWKVLLQNRQNPAVWDVLRFGWVGDYNDPYTFLEIFHSSHGQNFFGLRDAEYDALLQEASLERDAARRMQLLSRAERRVLDAYPIVPLHFMVSTHLVKPYVKGFESNVMDHNYTRHYRIERE